MSIDLINEGFERIKAINSWSLALINYNHKSRPFEYTCYSVKFSTDKLLKDTISSMCTSFLKVIDKNSNNIKDYTGMNSKGTVEKIAISNELIKGQWDKLIESFAVSDDTKQLKDIKSNAYIFAGTYTIDGQDKNIYLLTRKDPIYTYKKGRTKILESRNNTIDEIKEPLLQFNKSFDALVYNGILYSINHNFETIFNMEYTHKIVCKSSLEIIEQASIIKNFEAYKAFALSGHHPRKFITFDQRIIDNISQPDNLNIFTNELKIPYDSNKRMFILDDEVAAEVFTKAICGKTKYNMFFDGVCEVPTSTPLTLS